MKRFGLVFAILALFCGLPAFAQPTTPAPPAVTSPYYWDSSGTIRQAQGTFCIDPVTALTCSGGGGGGGGGDASAANQGVQITAANLTNTRLGDITAPATGSANFRLGQLVTSLGSPFQAGGLIGNSSFGISGTLPAFGTTPTFNFGTLNGAATAALQTTGNGFLSSLAAALSGTSLQVICTSGCTGGGGGGGTSILNAATYANTSSFSNTPAGCFVTTAAPTYTNGQASPTTCNTAGGIRVDGSGATQPVSGTVTANIGTVGTLATAALQTTGNTSLGNIDTNAGAQADAATASGGAGSISGKLRLMTTQLAAIQSSVASATPAGSNAIGNVGGLETAGSAATGGGFRTMGKDASNNAQDVRLDGVGGQFQGGMVPTSVRSASLTTSASTALGGGGSTTRPTYLKIQLETASTAALFICLKNQTCSATVYDEMIPSGATAGTRLFVEIPFTTAVTYFTTATNILNVTRWGD